MMRSVRMNITIPKDLAHQLDKLTAPRKRSQFISEALKHRIDEIEREEVRKALEEGYKARREESQRVAEEFEFADLEGWDGY